MTQQQALINVLCMSMYEFIGDRDDIQVFDILGALEQIRHTITEEFIHQHGDLIPVLAAIMGAQEPLATRPKRAKH